MGYQRKTEDLVEPPEVLDDESVGGFFLRYFPPGQRGSSDEQLDSETRGGAIREANHLLRSWGLRPPVKP
jgi:hypothetical protein